MESSSMTASKSNRFKVFGCSAMLTGHTTGHFELNWACLGTRKVKMPRSVGQTIPESLYLNE